MKLKVPDAIAFEVNKFDTHKAYDPDTLVYTFVADGDYVVTGENGTRKVTAKAGDTVKTPASVLNENCGVFYTSKLKEIKK